MAINDKVQKLLIYACGNDKSDWVLFRAIRKTNNDLLNLRIIVHSEKRYDVRDILSPFWYVRGCDYYGLVNKKNNVNKK